MANTSKMTKRDYFTILRNSYPTTADNYADVVSFIDHELELLDKKRSENRKPTERQLENEKFKTIIIDSLDNTLRTCSEIIKLIDWGEGVEMSTQRLSPILNAMVKDNTLVKTVDKRKTYFSLA